MPLALAIGLSSLVGAGASIFGASTEANAAQQAAQLQYQEYQNTQRLLSPYVQAGTGAIGGYQGALNTLQQGFNPQNLAATPGYQFQLQQGEQAVTDQATATGGVGGGNTLKALTQYGQGLASTTFQQQFQDWLSQNQSVLQGYGNLVNTGENAAAGTGAAGQTYANNAGNYLTQGASAVAGGATGVTNALNSGASNYLLASLLNTGGGGGFDANAFNNAMASASPNLGNYSITPTYIPGT